MPASRPNGHSPRRVFRAWFTVRTRLAEPALPADAVPLAEVARRTGRHPKAVAQALRDGRLRPAALDAAQRARWGRCVAATPRDLEAWRAWTLDEALAAHPDVPQNPALWWRASDVARVLGLSPQVVAWRLERHAPAAVAWGGDGPFRAERRYCLGRTPADWPEALRAPVGAASARAGRVGRESGRGEASAHGGDAPAGARPARAGRRP